MLTPTLQRLFTITLAAAIGSSLVLGPTTRADAMQPGTDTIRIPRPTTPQAAVPTPSAARSAVALGTRVRETQKKAEVIPTLVIVSDGASFLDAISHWTPELRFPVLIDDGSILAADNIARFVRAFAPTEVVRYQADGAAQGWSPGRAAIEKALAKVWSADSAEIENLKKAWTAKGHEPPGIVVANEKDTAWTAAIALAAARGQPLVWVDDEQAPRDLHKWWPEDEAAKLDKYLQETCAKSGLSWSDLGDTLDAVTLCGSFPNIIQVGPKDLRALTDRIGRLRIDGPARWAWSGQIFGNPGEAAYRAMCPLFLSSDEAWLFDTYPKSPPWNDFSLAQSKTMLAPGFKSTLSESPGANASMWREKTQHPLSPGLIFVNSKGNADFFELESGYGYCGDLPTLLKPAALHFIHSWSLQSPGSRNTLGGRWLERGVYLYYGSVNEPTLAAFTPCPQVSELLAQGAVFSGAARRDAGPAWRLTVLGDPLATVLPGAIGPKSSAKLPLQGVKPLKTEAAELARKGDFAPSIRAFILAGDEEMAVKLASALFRDRPAAVNQAVAKASIPALARAGRTADVVGMFQAANFKSDDNSTDTEMLRDCLWFACELSLKSRVSPPEASTLELLKQNLRPEQLDQDLIVLGGAWAQVFDFAAAVGMVEGVAARQTEPHLKKKGQRAIEEVRKSRR
ncbi:MAG: hypothetical protein KF805_05040 [Phycisphaeraceae bacterium]|nr:hypothetical protein [Phycisphaeraceae bacterium]